MTLREDTIEFRASKVQLQCRFRVQGFTVSTMTLGEDTIESTLRICAQRPFSTSVSWYILTIYTVYSYCVDQKERVREQEYFENLCLAHSLRQCPNILTIYTSPCLYVRVLYICKIDSVHLLYILYVSVLYILLYKRSLRIYYTNAAQRVLLRLCACLRRAHAPVDRRHCKFACICRIPRLHHIILSIISIAVLSSHASAGSSY